MVGGVREGVQIFSMGGGGEEEKGGGPRNSRLTLLVKCERTSSAPLKRNLR